MANPEAAWSWTFALSVAAIAGATPAQWLPDNDGAPAESGLNAAVNSEPDEDDDVQEEDV